MISPFTAPGTKVVALRNSKRPGVGEGQVYTVGEILHRPHWGEGVFGVVLTDAREARCSLTNTIVGWHISLFRKAELPRSLTAILDLVPVALAEKAKERA